jgi:subtilisin family serine protease
MKLENTMRAVARWLPCVMLAAAACGEAPPFSEVHSRARPHGAAVGGDRTVTLITGDRVTLTSGGPLVTPAPGRAQVAFAITRDRDHVIVTPSDVTARITAGQLDPALFDVTLLLAYGYGDGRRDDLPLIVTGQPDAGQLAQRLTTAGVIVDRALPALHAVAVRQVKASPGAVLAQLGPPAPGLAAGRAPKIWLDRVRKPLLDRSVPQIGGPAARARGLTGAGITVAVLDSGVDSAHPDLAGKVVAAENFTSDGGDALDVLGHGTHVASIIAGTGAASGGELQGVAPEVRLVSGRVCEGAFDCPDSAILAGIAWAVTEQHAQIVNLSLGGPDSPELDPLEDAVNQLSAQFGTLFVIAAGNTGRDGTIDSPGSADAALTVGAVDRVDQLARFSSRGPRTGDHAIKPDVTAPGVGVGVGAARAAGIDPIGDPVGTAYQALSGTSMATPHVAGAAALILQQHPDWTGAQLKAQLIGSAQPNPALTAFAQGAGRIDVDRGTRQAITAEPASLSLGLAVFPHADDPLLVRIVTYRNPGAAPIVLSLAASLALPDGQSAPPGMIQLGATALTIPAGGSADVAVTVDTRGDGPDGSYTGRLVATAGEIRVETPLAVEREVESYDVTVRLLDTSGAPTTGSVFLTRVPDDLVAIQFVVGEATLRLPRGRYALDVIAGDDTYFAANPRLDVDHDLTAVVDGRATGPVVLTLPSPDLVLANALEGYSDSATGHGFTLAGPEVRIGHVGPELPPAELLGWAFRALTSPPGAPLVRYNFSHHERGHLPTGWVETIRDAQLATVHARHAGPGDHIGIKLDIPMVDEGGLLRPIGGLGFQQALPFESTTRFFGRGVVWREELDDAVRFDGFLLGFAISTTLRDYRAGQRYEEQWNLAPFGPAFATRLDFDVGTGNVTRTPSATRAGDTLTIAPGLFTSQARPIRDDRAFVDHERFTLLRDGVVIAEQVDGFTDALPPTVVPPGPATYRFEQVSERPTDVFTLSTRAEAAWTFRSRHVTGTQVLPLPTMRFAPALDPHQETAARVLALPITFERPAGAATPPIVHATLEVSFDDGARWTRVPIFVVGDHALALLVHPVGARFVSLRGTAADLLGNRVEQTTIRAYGLR